MHDPDKCGTIGCENCYYAKRGKCPTYELAKSRGLHRQAEVVGDPAESGEAKDGALKEEGLVI